MNESNQCLLYTMETKVSNIIIIVSASFIIILNLVKKMKINKNKSKMRKQVYNNDTYRCIEALRTCGICFFPIKIENNFLTLSHTAYGLQLMLLQLLYRIFNLCYILMVTRLSKKEFINNI